MKNQKEIIEEQITGLRYDLDLLLTPDQTIEIGLFSYINNGYLEIESDFKYLNKKDKHLIKEVIINRIKWIIIDLEKQLENL